MLDKIRLHAAGELPEAYHKTLGNGFDERCLHFLQVSYDELKEKVLAGGMDDELLEWCFTHGRRPSPEEIEVWSDFMRKRGWRDASRERVVFRVKEAGLEERKDIVTMFDYIDVDEGRIPPDFSAWEPAR
jgi:hypothetical protein